MVDDGVATGATLRAALEYLRKAEAGTIVAAFPVGPEDTLRRLRPLVQTLVCPLIPEDFRAVGEFYRRFDPVSDDEVVRLPHDAFRRFPEDLSQDNPGVIESKA